MKFLAKKKPYLLSLALLAFSATAAHGQMVREGESYRALSATEPLLVPLFKSRVVELPAPANRISVGNPDVADILILRSSELYVLGKDLGTTNVLLWDNAERLIATVNVEVTHDLENLKTKLHVFLPDEPIEPTVSGDAARGARLFMTCAGCHGANGEGIWSTNAPRLAGASDWYLVTQLSNFKARIRGAHAGDIYGEQMALLSDMLPDEQAINDVVAYINTLP